MKTHELLSKINEFFQNKTNGKVSRELLKILPDTGPIVNQINKLGILEHEGKQVEAVNDHGEIIDLLVDGIPLLDKEPSPTYKLKSLSESSYEISFKARTYKILGIEKKKNKLNCTIRLDVVDKLHVDSLNLYQSSHRNRLIQEICNTFHFPANQIKEDFQTILKVTDAYQFQEAVSQSRELTEDEKKEALKLAKSPKLFELILKDYEKLGSIGEENNKLISYLAGVSRLFEKPLSVMVISSSGAGKSDLVTKTLSLMSPEDVIELTSLSAKALFYKGENSLKSKILSLEEDAGGESASYAIRQLISSSALTVESTIRDQLDGKIKTQVNKVNCQTAVFVTSTNPDTDQETKSRFFILHVDESEEQTQRIIKLQKQSHQLSSLSQVSNKEKVERLHQNLQRLLKYYPIVNPFVNKLKHQDNRLGARRNFPKYLTLIDSICLLRQFQKDVQRHESIEYLEVEQEDIKLAEKLFNYVVDNSISELNNHSRELLRVIKDKYPEESFSRKEVRDLTHWSLTKVQRCMTELLKHELVVLETGGRGKVHQYKLIQTYSELVG